MKHTHIVGYPSMRPSDNVNKIRGIAVPISVSILGTIIALFPNNPVNMTLPSRDSGVFLYVGWRFLSGDIPYRDVWDHKPPLVYFVDALGLTLTPPSLWGVWLLQIVFIFFGDIPYRDVWDHKP